MNYFLVKYFLVKYFLGEYLLVYLIELVLNKYVKLIVNYFLGSKYFLVNLINIAIVFVLFL